MTAGLTSAAQAAAEATRLQPTVAAAMSMVLRPNILYLPVLATADIRPAP